MATFAELEARVKFVVDTTGFRTPINIRKLLHESENEYIKRTFCTQNYIEYYVESPDIEFDGTATNIAFVKGTGSTKDTITDSDSGFVTDGFAAGQILTVDDSTSVDEDYEIYSVAAATITLKSIGRLTSEAGIAGMTIVADTIPNMVSLPSDFYKEYKVEFGDYILKPLNKSRYDLTTSTQLESDSTPYHYWIEGDYLHIKPRPAAAGTLRIWYHYYNTDDTSASPVMPTIDQLKIVDHTIAMLYEMDQKHDIAAYYYNKFNATCEEGRYKYYQRSLKQNRISENYYEGL